MRFMTRDTRARTLVLTTFAAGALGLTAGEAHATTKVAEAGDALIVTTTLGAANDIQVSRVPGNPPRLVVTDAGDAVGAGAGCGMVDPVTVACQTAGIARLFVAGLDRDDTIASSASLVATIDGGDGADVLSANGPGSLLRGGTGTDTLTGLARTRLDGGPDADVLQSLGTADTADYGARVTPVEVSLDGVANDGGAGEGDDVRPGVDSIVGGTEDDTLKGDGAGNQLSGGPGDDELGGAGNGDVLDGGPGDDVLSGGPGGDVFRVGPVQDGADDFAGGSGEDEVSYAPRAIWVSVDLDDVADDGGGGELDNVRSDIEVLRGGADNDTLRGSAVGDHIIGGAGRDAINGLDGSDLLDGGPGADVLAGGTGPDMVTYAARSAPVVADIDGAADDGEQGERDNIALDVEDINGGRGPDTLIGSASANRLFGQRGDDRLIGLDDDDLLAGGHGADTLLGGRGNDGLDGVDNVAANDILNGESGTDACLSDAGDAETDCEL